MVALVVSLEVTVAVGLTECLGGNDDDVFVPIVSLDLVLVLVEEAVAVGFDAGTDDGADACGAADDPVAKACVASLAESERTEIQATWFSPVKLLYIEKNTTPSQFK